MPVVPDLMERLVFFRLNQAPGPALDLVGAGTFRAVATALKLGVFDALNEQPSAAADLASKLRVDQRAVTVLLDFLTATRYLKRTNEGYSCTAMSTKWLSQKSPTNFAPFFDFFQNFLYPFWDTHIEESIRTGKPSTTLYESLDQTPNGWKTAQEWFLALAKTMSDEIVSKAKLSRTAKRLLDVGGGHGLYTVKFCRNYPALSATIFDRPEPSAVARETIANEKMEGRVSVLAGDFWRDNLGDGYDSVLLFNIIHAYKPEENIELLKKISGVLNPRGQVVILEQISEPTSSNAVGALVQFLGLTFLAALGGRTYEYEEVARWLSASGFSGVKRVKLRRAPGSSLVLATKAG